MSHILSLDDLEITLNRGWEDNGRYVWSPFVTKLELRLRLAGIKYKTAAGNAFKEAPTGKIPYVNIHSKSTSSTMCIGDSALIAKWFVEQGFASELNTRLDATGAAHDLALKSLVEDKLYFYNVRPIISVTFRPLTTGFSTDARTMDGQLLYPS